MERQYINDINIVSAVLTFNICTNFKNKLYINDMRYTNNKVTTNNGERFILTHLCVYIKQRIRPISYAKWNAPRFNELLNTETFKPI